MQNERKNTLWGRVALGGLLIVFTILLMVSFYNTSASPVRENLREDIDQQELFGDERGQNVNLEDVVQNPEGYYGQVVSVRGEVDQNMGTRGVTIETVGLADDELLVVSRDALVGVGGGPGDALYNQDDDVRVSGVVREFSIVQLEQELGIDLDDKDYQEFEGKPVIIADSIAEISE